MDDELMNVNSLEEWHAYVKRRSAADLAELEATRHRPLVERSGGQGDGPTIVFSVRLDRDMAAAMERRAAALAVGPTVLARNLIRNGLNKPSEHRLTSVIASLESLLAELKQLAA